MAVPDSGDTCVVCEGAHVSTFIEIGDVPVFCNVTYETREEAHAARRGDLRLTLCQACGHVFNHAFEPSRMDYSEDYENSLHYSPRFRAFISDLSQHLIETYGVRDKTIVDVGCGKGDFLAQICADGGNRGWGFDRSYAPERAAHDRSAQIEFVQEFYSPENADLKPDLVCCRHVLEHIEAPRGFMDDIRRSLAESPDAVVYFEVPNVLYTLRDMGIWDLIYEHCSYFSPASLRRLFAAAGFEVLETRECYEGQFLGIEAQRRTGDGPVEVGGGSVDGVAGLAENFGERYRSKVALWADIFAGLDREGRRVAVWGAGSKGVTFLNVMRAPSISAIVDINPHKVGRFVAGTGHQIVSPESLVAAPPDAVIIMNPAYTTEIGRTLSGLGLAPQLYDGDGNVLLGADA